MILITFTGPNKYSFADFFKDENTVTLEYPGRGSRVNEELLTDINDLVNDVFLQFQKEMITSED
ncbi:MAG: external thioesterase TEII [Flavobacteriales bacterium]